MGYVGDCVGEDLSAFSCPPTTGQLVHGGIQVILVEILGGLVQAAGAGQERDTGVIDQRPLGIGKENAAKDHGPQQTGMAGRSHRAKKPVHLERVIDHPTVAQDGQPSKSPGGGGGGGWVKTGTVAW